MTEIDNNPANVQYWELAKEFAARMGRGVATEYAKLAGVTADEIFSLSAQELCDHHNKGAS